MTVLQTRMTVLQTRMTVFESCRRESCPCSPLPLALHHRGQQSRLSSADTQGALLLLAERSVAACSLRITVRPLEADEKVLRRPCLCAAGVSAPSALSSFDAQRGAAGAEDIYEDFVITLRLMRRAVGACGCLSVLAENAEAVHVERMDREMSALSQHFSSLSEHEGAKSLPPPPPPVPRQGLDLFG